MMENATAVMQNLLYDKPLFDWTKEPSNIKILTLGAGVYAQKFIDLCLEVGQIPGYHLEITAISENSVTAEEAYTTKRPALEDFVNINGSLNEYNGEKYGVLNFKQAKFIENNFEHNKNIVENYLDEYRYIFVALGNDELNEDIAKCIASTFREAGGVENCLINFATTKDFQNTDDSDINAVIINKNVDVTSAQSELERMAFNTHLVWKNALNADIEKIQKEYNSDEYSRLSSQSFALSIRYKLRSLGIYDSDFKVAAANFSKILTEPENKEKLSDMLAYEHRRWVISNLVDGWKTMTEYNDCAERGSVKDKGRKLHPCLVRGNNILTLQSDEYVANNHRLWDTATEEQLNNLDELDLMSVKLHRSFSNPARLFKETNPLENNENIVAIENLIGTESEKIKTAYKIFKLCLSNILAGTFDANLQGNYNIAGSYSYSKQYGHYEEIFIESLNNLENEDNKTAIENYLKNIQKDFFAVIEFNLYRDYKNIDMEFIEKIPFMLTYVPLQNLAMAFDDGRLHNGRNEELFRNVASAMTINPKVLNYIYYFDKTVTTEFFVDKLHSVLNYIQVRRMNFEVCLILAIKKDSISAAGIENLKQNLSEGYKEFFNCEIFVCDDEASAIEKFVTELKSKSVKLFDGSTMMFPSNKIQGMFTAKVAEVFDYFEFDSENKIFKNCDKCSHLNFIKSNSYIRIDDMFALNKAQNIKFKFPDFSRNYLQLWNIYSSNANAQGIAQAENLRRSVKNWNSLCDKLQKIANDELNEIYNPHERTQRFNELLNVNDFDFGANYIYALLQEIQQRNLIRNLVSDGGHASFTYVSPRAKTLLTTAGEILELYTYFEALKTGYFDDAACSYEFKRQQGNVKNEIDCILVKGLHTMIIECKSCKQINQDYYHKLNSIADQFGVNCTKVLIANTYADSGNVAIRNANNLQRERGKQMNIITVSNWEDIQNIGSTLVKIIEGTYKN